MIQYNTIRYNAIDNQSSESKLSMLFRSGDVNICYTKTG